MNIECNADSLKELTEAFRYNDAVIRNLVVKKDEAVTGDSPLIKIKEEEAAKTASKPAEKAAPEAAAADTTEEKPAQEAEQESEEKPEAPATEE